MDVLDDESTAVSKTVRIDKDKAIYIFKSTNKEALGQKLNEYLLGKGYKMEAGTPINATYGKGSKTMRVLFGAFAKRFEWQVEISEINQSTGLTFRKNTKGIAGGLIGIKQVKNEYDRLTETLKAFHENHNNKP